MLWKIAWRNIIHKPLNALLCISLLLFGVGIISLLLIIQKGIEQKFEADLNNIDIVVGAKGSPLQLVLSAVYHIDSPTGNIKLEEAQKLMKNPMVKEAIPLAYGDSYEGHRILGTSTAYLSKYTAEFEEGKTFAAPMEAVIGWNIAQNKSLKIGSTFYGTHGESEEGHVHDNKPYTVVGLLKQNNTVLDNLVLTDLESVWHVHEKEEHNHGHDHHHAHAESKKEITALLITCKTKMAVLSLPRTINQQTNMQAVLPGLEINKLLHMIGIGTATFKLIAYAIMLMAGLSVFFALYARLKERRAELALMRSLGYSPISLFSLLLIEGGLLALLGYGFGLLASRIGIYLINQQALQDYNHQFEASFLAEEWTTFLLTLIIGLVAALLPAWRAMRIDVATTLTKHA